MTRYEAEVAAGLAPICTQEIRQLDPQIKFAASSPSDAVVFSYRGSVTRLLQLKTVIAVYEVLSFDIPRPKALLGHQNWQRLLERIEANLGLLGADQYASFYISAAGSNSSVMQRIKQALAEATGLTNAETEGDLLLRIRPTPNRKRSWDVLIRLTPRPLATREWRVCNMEGALNASVARAMVYLSQPTQTDQVLNLACGSGTVLIERQMDADTSYAIGVDIDPQTLAYARQNVEASGIVAELLHADATNLPFANQQFNQLFADLPFGQLVGSHEDNVSLYPALLTEAARVAQQGAKFVLITHEVTLMKQLLHEMQDNWRCLNEYKITLSGLHPRIYVLERMG